MLQMKIVLYYDIGVHKQNQRLLNSRVVVAFDFINFEYFVDYVKGN